MSSPLVLDSVRDWGKTQSHSKCCNECTARDQTSVMKFLLLININILIYYWRIRIVWKWELHLQLTADWLGLLLFQINRFLSAEMLLFMKACLLSLGLHSSKLRNWISVTDLYHGVKKILWITVQEATGRDNFLILKNSSIQGYIVKYKIRQPCLLL
jgi:hypothetical protein